MWGADPARCGGRDSFAGAASARLPRPLVGGRAIFRARKKRGRGDAAEPRASPDRATGRECQGLVENRIEDILAQREIRDGFDPRDTTGAKRATIDQAAARSGAAVWGWEGAVGGGAGCKP